MKITFNSMIYLLFLINSLISIIIITLERKKPEKTIAWVLIIILLPPIGLILYIFLGRNWKVNKLNDKTSYYINKLVFNVINKIKNSDYINLVELLAKNSDSPLFIDNNITIFKDGEKKFECLKKELNNAKHHIHLEYYIVKNDIIGNEIKDILIKKSIEGIKVKFIIDKVGSIKLSKKYIKELEASGVDVVLYSYFLSPLLKHINTQINYRNHRKIVVIDGKIGFIGGMNIGDEYLGKGKLGYWRDTHIMVKGDFVLGLQAIFLDDFYTIKQANKELFFYDNNKELNKYFPKPSKSKNKIMQLIKSGPNSTYPSIMQCMLKMISMAKHHIYITTPYFIPTESILENLKVASLSGINIKILFPGKYDHIAVYYASKTYLQELCKCGCEIYFYKKDSFIHSKVITIDGKISSVGTANMDIRSYELNYEINAVIYDNNTTEELENLFFEDLKYSKEIFEEDFKNVPILEKVIEAITRIFSSIL